MTDVSLMYHENFNSFIRFFSKILKENEKFWLLFEPNRNWADNYS